MPNQFPQLERVFFALSDPTRLAVLARLAEGPAPVSELARPFDMALPSFTQHLGVLQASGLVSSQKQGRARIYQLKPERLQEAETWLHERRALWQQRLAQLDNYLIELKERS